MSEKIIDPSRQHLLIQLNRLSRLVPYPFNCLLFGIFLYLIGIPFAYINNTHFAGFGQLQTGYLEDYFFILLNIIAGFFLASVFRFLNMIDDVLLELSRVLEIQDSDLQKFIVKSERTINSRLYLIFSVTLMIIIGLFSLSWITNPEAIVIWTSSSYVYSSCFYISWILFVSYGVGLVLGKIIFTTYIMMSFCKEFLFSSKITPISPDRRGGLRPLGNLALAMDFAMAIPSFGFIYYFLRLPIQTLFLPKEHPLVIGITVVYSIILAIFFFVPLSRAHNAMAKSKKETLYRISHEYSQTYRQYLSKTQKEQSLGVEIEFLNKLKWLRELYKEAEKIAVWPFDLEIILKFITTVSIPIIGYLLQILEVTINIPFW